MEIGKLYKVRSKKTGLYSIGSRHGSLNFTAKGKTFNTIGNVKSMLKQFKSDNDKGDYRWMNGHSFNDLEIITYEVNEVDVQNASELMK